MPTTTKSSRHSKITGDFAEMLVLYWLSKSGFECARIDHTGIDLIACAKDGSTKIGISVQSRSRRPGQERESVNLHPFEETRAGCKPFGCVPYSAIVVDRGASIGCYLLPLNYLEKIAGGKITRTWSMKDEFLKARRDDPKVQWFEFEVNSSRWHSMQRPAASNRVRAAFGPS